MIKNNLKKYLKYWFCLILILSSLKAQFHYDESISKFLLTELDNFQLKSQFRNDWIVGHNNKLQKSLRQTWISNIDNTKEITIDISVFNTIPAAIEGTAYNSQSYSNHYFWGPVKIGVLGDDLWVNDNRNALILVKANVGVQIGVPCSAKDEYEIMEVFAKRVLKKISENLSPEIQYFIQTEKQNQVSNNDYNRIVNDIFKLDVMEEYTHSRISNSTWMVDDNTFRIGLKNEWVNNSGSIIGIDICQFKTGINAEKATVVRLQNTSSYFFDLKNMSDKITMNEKWKKDISMHDTKKHNLSVITYHDSFVVHIYQYHPDKINFDSFYKLIKQLDI